MRSACFSIYCGRRYLRRSVSNAVHHVLDVLCPERCAACRMAQCRELFCAECAPKATASSRHVDVDDNLIPAYAAYTYSSKVVRAAVHRFKFESHPELARRMAPLMLSALPISLVPTLWLPVPLAIDQLAIRGFNQSALLASELAKATLAQSAPRLLRRRVGLPQQSKLGRRPRLTNVASAFTVAPRQVAHLLRQGSVNSLPSIVLVDDVLTTGATVRACCATLHQAGMTVGAILTFAAVPPPAATPTQVAHEPD